MRIAILAQFPIHLLPGFEQLGEPKHHYATWLPQLAQGFSRELENSADPTSFSRERTPQQPRTNNASDSIHWVTLSHDVEASYEVPHLGQTFHVLPTARKGRASSLFRNDRAAIRNQLVRIRPDLVHGWGNEDVYGWAAVESGFPNMVSIQGLLSAYAIKNRLPGRTYLQALIELYVINDADALVCESQWAIDMTKKRMFVKSPPAHLVEYGVQEIFYRSEWSPNPAKPVAIFTGSADTRKGIQDVIRAFRDPRIANAELWILGEANSKYGKSLQQIAPHNVRWMGRLPIEESVAYLRQGWCFVLPTRADTGPMAIKEARVVGLPVISSPHSGARDYIKEGKNGYLVEPGDVGALTDRLVRLLSDFDLCKKMGGFQHSEDREYFHPARTAGSLLTIYRQMVGEKR